MNMNLKYKISRHKMLMNIKEKFQLKSQDKKKMIRIKAK